MEKDRYNLWPIHPCAFSGDGALGTRKAERRGQPVLYLSGEVSAVRQELVSALKAAGYSVKVATADLRSACRLLRRRDWLLVVLDIDLPGLESYQLCAGVRGRSRLPIMLLLRSAGDGDMVQAFNAGADACMVSPIQPREFVARLEALARRRPVERF